MKKYTMTGIVLVVLLLGMSTAVATDIVTRTLPATASPDDTITVSLAIDFDDRDAVNNLAITETIPDGWVVVDASDAGDFTTPCKVTWVKVKAFGTLPPDGALFTYNVTVPADADGMYLFSGVYGTNVAGTNIDVLGDVNVTIDGDTYDPPTLTAYTITNTTITPPQTTSIDVAFSEYVSATIKIEDAGGDLVNQLYSSSNVKNPTAKTWDGTYTDGTTVPDGTYTVNVTGVNTTTELSVINTSETITVTNEDTTPPVITDVVCDTPTTNSVTITWTTDEDSDSLVKYGTETGVYTDNESNTTMVTSHSIMLTGLTPETTYYFVVNSTDASDNPAESDEYNFTTAAVQDTTPPVITDVVYDMPTTDSVTITWTTDEDSNSLVKYGTETGVYTDNESNTTMVTSHSIMLTGLTPETTYYFVVNSTDASDNPAESAEYSFTTAAEAVVTITDWTLDATGTRGTSIDATVNITNTGTETLWFVVSVSGTQAATGYPLVGLGTVQLAAGATIDAPVMIVVPGSADTGDYTLTPVVYRLDEYPAGAPKAIGSGESVTIS